MPIGSVEELLLQVLACPQIKSQSTSGLHSFVPSVINIADGEKRQKLQTNSVDIKLAKLIVGWHVTILISSNNNAP